MGQIGKFCKKIFKKSTAVVTALTAVPFFTDLQPVLKPAQADQDMR